MYQSSPLGPKCTQHQIIWMSLVATAPYWLFAGDDGLFMSVTFTSAAFSVRKKKKGLSALCEKTLLKGETERAPSYSKEEPKRGTCGDIGSQLTPQKTQYLPISCPALSEKTGGA